MAAGWFSKDLVCIKPCGHTDCKATWEDSVQLCRFCKKPIGFGTSFYKDPEGGLHSNGNPRLVHALCLEMEILDAKDEVIK